MNPAPGSDQPSHGGLWSYRTDRRTLLKGAAAIGAASLAAPLLTRTSASAATRPVIYGANHNYFERWIDYVSGSNGPNPPPPGTPLASPNGKNCERRYFDAIVPYDDGVGDKSGNYSPLITDWASMGAFTDYAIVSLRINPVYALQSPQITIPDNGSGYTRLDDQISHLLSTMPAASVLTNWQEAGPGNTLNFPQYVTAESVSGLHNHMQNLANVVKQSPGTQVNYGQIVIDNPNHPDFQSYLGRNLNCYMIDIYDYSDTKVTTAACPNGVGGPGTGTFRNADGTLSQTKINTRMDNYLAAFEGATTSTPLIHISETNSPQDSHRKNWFLFLSEWMAANNGARICSHWAPCGPDSGDWPTDQGLLDYFVYLQATYGA